MKQIILLVFSFCSIVGFSHDKLNGNYSAGHISDGGFYYISLYENENYTLFLSENITLDIICDRTISFGNFYLENNVITFQDQTFGFTMKAQLISDGIIVFNQCFHILKDIPFSFSGDPDIEYFEPQIQKEQALAQSSSFFYLGKYKDKNNEYVLSIKEDNRYTLYYKNNLFLEGTWKEEDNEMQLYDYSLKHTFYMSIGENKLIVKHLPGEYNSFELIYSSSCDKVSSSHDLNMNHGFKFLVFLLFPFLVFIR